MIKANVLLVLAAALVLCGCDVTSSSGSDGPGLLAGAFAASGPATADPTRERAAAAAVTAAALGGLIGSKLGSALDDSGRILAEVVDTTGVDHDVAYITELPHRYYLVITSKGVDWTVTAEEPILP